MKLEDWLCKIDDHFIEGFCKQLIELGQYLAKCFIETELKLDNIGID